MNPAGKGKGPAFPGRLAGILAAALVTALGPPLQSQSLTAIDLVSEVRSIQPGVPFYVGLSIRLGPGYHTYWKFPGIAGVATSIRWMLPAGFEAGPIEWPEPERVLMAQVKCQGFERDVILPVKITPPADLSPGQSIRIEGMAAWLHCTQACQASVDRVGIELPVRRETPAYDPRWRQKFDAERLRVARPSDSWVATAAETGRSVTLTLSPAAATARRLSGRAEAEKLIFFTDDGWIDSDKPQIVDLREDGTLVITLTRAEVYLGERPPAQLSGIVQNPAGWLAGENLRSLQISPVLKR